MEKFIQKGTEDEPEIILDESTLKFSISGISTPEDAIEIYQNVLEWISKVVPNIQTTLNCEFFFIYLSSASHKMIFAILKRLEEFWENGKDIKINWKFEDADDDMRELAEDFSDLLNLPFKIVCVY
ncbi:MAG: DUF1987 domain-containing protein [Chlorobi bacterium]|nr:DUF1987 domain-containing protein [Chlorobiota bacterium]